MVCYEVTLAKAGIRDAAEELRRKKALTIRTAKVEKTGRKMPPIISGFQQLTQRTAKFIRWVRRFLWTAMIFSGTPLLPACRLAYGAGIVAAPSPASREPTFFSLSRCRPCSACPVSAPG